MLIGCNSMAMQGLIGTSTPGHREILHQLKMERMLHLYAMRHPSKHRTMFIPIHTSLAYHKQLIWIGSLPSESLSPLQTNKTTILWVKLLFVTGQWDDGSSVTPASEPMCTDLTPPAKGTCGDGEHCVGDIKPRQMGWNNGTLLHVCDRLDQLIKATAIYWR